MLILLSLLASFSLFSLMAVGGAVTLIPAMHSYVVDSHHWMSGQEFAALFAIAQAAPGPNVLVVSLIGWKVAGLAGALVATVGMCGPSSLLCYYVTRLWQRFHGSPWRRAIERGLAPLTIGLVAGSAMLMSEAANARWTGWLLCGVVAVIAWRSRINPLWLLAGGAVLGWLGWI
ncbi:chromate transporter [Aquitalea sp. LB_tupeE]|uniref:chromate transporter n=1 Tax=Aquitalea sp. LB_tupeE TaxID=2748078 RepID=UPI001C4B1A95|nr:chromate transporter [Aquitalea sp. LB_tupeE]